MNHWHCNDKEVIYISEDTNFANPGEPTGFGGWLVLVSIGFILSFFWRTAYLFYELVPLITSQDFIFLTTPGSEAYDSMWKITIYSELFMNTSIIILMLVIGYVFLKEKTMFKYLMIVYLLLNLICSIVDFYMIKEIDAIGQYILDDSAMQVFRNVVICAIWIPYFMFSKRVRNIFIFK